MGLDIKQLVPRTSGWPYFEGFVLEEPNIPLLNFLTNLDFTNNSFKFIIQYI